MSWWSIGGSMKCLASLAFRTSRFDGRRLCKYLGSERLCDITVVKVDGFMAKMIVDGYSPRSVTKSFQLLKQAFNYAIAQDFLRKNPCSFCKPPKRTKTPINALSREKRSRMLDLARQVQPNSIAIAIVIMLTIGMRRGEVCALRWSDFNEVKKTITVSHSFGNGEGGFCLKEPKSGRTRTIPSHNTPSISLRECMMM